VLWQVSKLSREAGIDARTLSRERLAVATTAQILPAIRSIALYRHALVLQEPPAAIAPLRADAARRMDELAKEFRAGDAASLGAQSQWVDAWTVWRTAAHASPGADAYDATTDATHKLEILISTMQDNSNLTYDPSMSAQNLADAALIATPVALDLTYRAKALADLAIAKHSLTLKQRFSLSGAVNTMRSFYDYSTENLPGVIDTFATLLPERTHATLGLPALANAVTSDGTQYRNLLSESVLLQQTPTTSATAVDAAASKTLAAVSALHNATASALDASLVRRGELSAKRNQYFYLAFIIGAVLMVGIMIAIAQAVARRDRIALRELRQESDRLAAELAWQHAEEALRLSEAQFRAVFDGAAVGIAVVDRNGKLVDANEVFRTMFGDFETAIEGHETQLAELLAGRRETFEFEHHSRTPAGGEAWTDATVSIVTGQDDAPTLAICMFRDKTELKHSERRMQHDKTHDSLTGLPNRHLFEEHLRRRFDESSALLDSFFAVLFIDLEHFKDVNESMGHAAGDLVLTQIAQRLRASIDPRDIAARLGSDEFAILIQSLGDILHVESVARRVLNNLSKVIAVGSRSIYLGASVGIAIGSSGYERAEDVMRDAEIAMQHAKSTGGARYALFDSKMHSRAQKRLQLTSDLRLALERNEFHLLYQPILSIADGSPVGCEALVRWNHPTEGPLSPSDFVPLAEQTGLAIPLGRFVLQTAIEQLAAWRRNRNGNIDFDMHINVSAAELLDPDFERVLLQFIEHHGLAPEDLTIEITESVVLDAGTRAHLTLERIRNRGFKICIDDFGTGYSSLRYLQQFKVDAIKIDRSFVAGNDGELASEPIVRTLMTLAEAFDVRVVAEGVETTRQRDLLRNVGCRFSQGFLYARPISADEMVALYPDVLGKTQRSASA
jgi:diguanylate cyclase (GGDEF)-like protein/PAS domain S-box-containing protein